MYVGPKLVCVVKWCIGSGLINEGAGILGQLERGLSWIDRWICFKDGRICFQRPVWNKVPLFCFAALVGKQPVCFQRAWCLFFVSCSVLWFWRMAMYVWDNVGCLTGVEKNVYFLFAASLNDCLHSPLAYRMIICNAIHSQQLTKGYFHMSTKHCPKTHSAVQQFSTSLTRSSIPNPDFESCRLVDIQTHLPMPAVSLPRGSV